jgi:shikimate kinase
MARNDEIEHLSTCRRVDRKRLARPNRRESKSDIPQRDGYASSSAVDEADAYSSPLQKFLRLACRNSAAAAVL